MNNKESKNAIINSVVDLLKNGCKIENLTSRYIVDKAGVSLCLINHHFGKKKNLIAIAVRKLINEVVKNSQLSYEADSYSQIISALDGPASFLALYPQAAKISIFYDLEEPSESDSISATVKYLEPYFKNFFNDNDVTLKVEMAIAALQFYFLRSEVSKTMDNLDFTDKQNRDIILKKIINSIS